MPKFILKYRKSDFFILFYAAQFPTRGEQFLFYSGGREVCSHTWR